MTAMDKAAEGLMLAGTALGALRQQAVTLNGVASALATQGFDLVEKEAVRLVDQAERVANQAERAVDIVEAVAQHHKWIETPDTDEDTPK
jgi:hypothetical protein